MITNCCVSVMGKESWVNLGVCINTLVFNKTVLVSFFYLHFINHAIKVNQYLARMFANVFHNGMFKEHNVNMKKLLKAVPENTAVFLPQMVNGALGQIGLPAQQLVERVSG